MIVVSPNHPLAKRKEIAFSELKDEPFVLLNEHYVHPTAFKKWRSRLILTHKLFIK